MKEDVQFDEIMKKFLSELKDEDQLTEKQKRIMQAAIKLFAEKGFHGASTSEIAKEAGVAEGTIFRHFKTKKDILISLVAPMVLKFASPLILRDVRDILQSDLAVDAMIREVYKNRLNIIENNWDRIRLIVQEMQFHPELRKVIVENLVGIGRSLTEAFVRQKINEGVFRPLPPSAITRALVSAMVGYVFFKFAIFPEEGLELDDEREIALMTDILLHGIIQKS